jgi:hypothetical protein
MVALPYVMSLTNMFTVRFQAIATSLGHVVVIPHLPRSQPKMVPPGLVILASLSVRLNTLPHIADSAVTQVHGHVIDHWLTKEERVATTVQEAIKAVPVWIGPEALEQKARLRTIAKSVWVMLRRMRVFRYPGASKLREIILRTSFSG